MEKKQISTFLKILQIPTNAPPEEIKQSLLDSGWNEADANEAISILHPDHEPATDDSQTSTSSPQLVAQKYVRSEVEVAPEEAKTAASEEFSSSNLPESTKAGSSVEKTVTSEVVPPPKPPPVEEVLPEDGKEHPHTDAPWLKDTVDIYDVSEEEKQRMIRTVYRTNERLTPQTIHALLGIDVDLSEYEAAYKKEVRNTIGWTQILIILVTSLIVAGSSIFLGLYHFEVGPFHPTVNGGK